MVNAILIIMGESKMDVFGEIEVELLELEAEQGFLGQGFMGDGMGADAGYLLETQIAPVMTEQAFDTFSDLNSFAAYDMPQDSVGTLGNSALTGALAEWLDAFVNVDSFVNVDDAATIDDDAPSLDEKSDLVLMTEGDGTPPDPNNPTFWDEIHDIVDLNGDGQIYGEGEYAALAAAALFTGAALVTSGWVAAAYATGAAGAGLLAAFFNWAGDQGSSNDSSNDSGNNGNDGEGDSEDE